MLGEFGVIVVCSGWFGGRAAVGPGRSARGRYAAAGLRRMIISLGKFSKWMMSYVIGSFLALAFLILLSPLAFLSMFGSGLMGFWILYNLIPVPIAFGASGVQAFTIQSLRGHRLAWVLSSTLGWFCAAIVALSMPEFVELDFLSAPAVLTAWLGGALFAGFLQWATVLRSYKSLLWIPAKEACILLVLAIDLILFRLAAFASGIFPSDTQALSMTWFVALALSFLVLLVVGLATVGTYAFGMGAAFDIVSSEADEQAA
jgi:hypothetical protein